MTKAYEARGKYMWVKLPLEGKTLQASSWIDRIIRSHLDAGNHLKHLAGIMKHLLPQEKDITQEIVLSKIHSTLSFC